MEVQPSWWSRLAGFLPVPGQHPPFELLDRRANFPQLQHGSDHGTDLVHQERISPHSIDQYLPTPL
jgi:hypothetical protein